MQRLYGSDDLFPDDPRNSYRPFQSVNFITAHDGFCLYDLVSYNHKHNEANGHGNNDGTDDNRSWNCGWEGDDGAPAEVLRFAAVRCGTSFAFSCFRTARRCFRRAMSSSPPIEATTTLITRTTKSTIWTGTYCGPTTISSASSSSMIAFRKAHPSIARSQFWREDVRWFGRTGKDVDLSPEGQTLAYCLYGARLRDDDIYVMVNAGAKDVRVPGAEGKAAEWMRVVDTSLPSPLDIADPGERRLLESSDYPVRGRSVVVLCRAEKTGGVAAASGVLL